MTGNEADNCPACGAAVEGPWCTTCGLQFSSSEARELRTLASRLEAAEEMLQATWRNRDVLAHELAARRSARSMTGVPPSPVPAPLRGWQPPAVSTRATPNWTRPPSPRQSGEWTVDRIRNLLLWAGAALLALSALAFTAVAWTHLGPGGRASLLVVLTFIAAAGATAARDRLPATSGALTGLAIALALIDWQIVRRAGAAPGLSSTAWWAIGTGVVGAAALALGQVASRTTAQRAVALLLPTSAVLAVAAGVSSTWAGALGLSLLAAALAGVLFLRRDRATDPVVRELLRLEASISWIVGVVLAIDAAVVAITFAQTLTPAAVMLTFAIAPAAVLSFSSASASDRVSAATLVLATTVGAALTLVSTSVGSIGAATLAVVLGCIAIASAAWCTDTWRGALRRTGVVAATPGTVFAASMALLAEAGPLAWLAHAWTGSIGANAASVVSGPDTTGVPELGWCAVGILLSIAVATAIALRPGPARQRDAETREWPAVPLGALLVAGAMAPLAAGASVGVTCAVVAGLLAAALLATAVMAHDDPDRALTYSALAVLPAVPAAGWAAISAGASISVLALVVVSAAVAAVITRVPALRAVDAALAALATAGLATIVALAAGTSPEAAGFAAAVVAGALMGLGAQVRRDTIDGIAVEITGAVGLVGGALLAVPSPVWLAATLTASVPLLLAAGLRAHRTVIYGVAAACMALGATWAWLFAADVTIVEAYTLPAAALALGFGALARREGPAHSWLTLAPAVVLALAPTLMQAIANNDDGRAIAVGLGALAIVLAGAYRRLQAPIVIGTAALVALGVEKLGPTAVRLPRWLMLAFAGSVLLWVGTTFERRRDDALRAARRFEQLG